MSAGVISTPLPSGRDGRELFDIAGRCFLPSCLAGKARTPAPLPSGRPRALIHCSLVTSRHEFGDQTARDLSKPLHSVTAIHAHSMESPNVRVVASHYVNPSR